MKQAVHPIDRFFGHESPHAKKGPGYSGTNLQEPSETEFKLHISPSGGIEVVYFLCAAEVAKLDNDIKRCTSSFFIAICPFCIARGTSVLNDMMCGEPPLL